MTSCQDLVAYVENVIARRTTPHPDTDAGRLARLIVTAALLHNGASLEAAVAAVSGQVATPVTPPCTGMTAGWCPAHGTCRCRGRADGYGPSLNDPDCPLHAPDSAHAESNRSAISLWGHCDDDGCPLPHDRDPEGVRRHELPDDHPVVVSLRASERLRRAEVGP